MKNVKKIVPPSAKTTKHKVMSHKYRRNVNCWGKTKHHQKCSFTQIYFHKIGLEKTGHDLHSNIA